MEQALPKQVTVILLTGKEQRKKRDAVFQTFSAVAWKQGETSTEKISLRTFNYLA